MANALLSVINYVDSGTMRRPSDGEAPDLPIENVQRPAISEIWRGGTRFGDLAYVIAEFGQVRQVEVLAAAWPRWGVVPAPTDGLRARLRLDGADVFDTGVVESGVDPVARTWFLRLPQAVEADAFWLGWDYDITLPKELGRLWAGPAIQTPVNVAYPLERIWADEGRKARSPRSGVIRTDLGPRPRQVGFQHEVLRDAEAEALLEAQRVHGRTGQVLFCWDPESPAKTTLFGRVDGLSPLQSYSFNLSRLAYRIEEDL